MKKIRFTILALLFCTAAIAQYDTTAPYLKSKAVPTFKLLALDSVVFTQTILDNDKATIIMLFNPGCDHCQQQLKLLLSMPEIAVTTNLLLTSTEPLKKLQDFYTKFDLQKYPWIHIGKDYTYYLGGYYRPKTIPVLAFYNKQKQLTFFKQGNVPKNEISDALKK
jgi:hypothetical protein